MNFILIEFAKTWYCEDSDRFSSYCHAARVVFASVGAAFVSNNQELIILTS